jgi:hypothetical protein
MIKSAFLCLWSVLYWMLDIDISDLLKIGMNVADYISNIMFY